VLELEDELKLELLELELKRLDPFVIRRRAEAFAFAYP